MLFRSVRALALIKGKLEEHGLLRDAQLYEINANTELTFKNMSVTFFRTTHSIPEPLGIVIHTPQGKIVWLRVIGKPISPASI